MAQEKRTYRVTIEETLARTVSIEALSEEEALEEAERMWLDAEVVLSGDDFDGEPYFMVEE